MHNFTLKSGPNINKDFEDMLSWNNKYNADERDMLATKPYNYWSDEDRHHANRYTNDTPDFKPAWDFGYESEFKEPYSGSDIHDIESDLYLHSHDMHGQDLSGRFVDDDSLWNESIVRKITEDVIDHVTKRKPIPKTTQGRMNLIYNEVNKNRLNRKFKDETWSAIDEYKNVIENLGFNVSIWCEGDGYSDYDEYDHMAHSKIYNLRITCEDGGRDIEGYIKLMAAGTVEYPFDEYDSCIMLWPADKNIDESIRRNLRKSLKGYINHM